MLLVDHFQVAEDAHRDGNDRVHLEFPAWRLLQDVLDGRAEPVHHEDVVVPEGEVVVHFGDPGGAFEVGVDPHLVLELGGASTGRPVGQSPNLEFDGVLAPLGVRARVHLPERALSNFLPQAVLSQLRRHFVALVHCPVVRFTWGARKKPPLRTQECAGRKK